jgi:hypothetical protein
MASGTNAVDDNINQMKQAQADFARLSTASMTVNVGVQSSATTMHTMNGASGAAGEAGKQTGNAIKDAAKAA